MDKSHAARGDVTRRTALAQLVFCQGCCCGRVDRGRPALDKAGEVADPVERLRRLLGTEVRELAPVRRGVCYPFEGK